MRNTEWLRALLTLDPAKVWPAANEVIVVGAISLAPLILASVGNHFGSVVRGGETIALTTDLAKSILSGQLLFYAMSFIASVVWHSSQDLARPFPLRIWFYFISFCFAMVCALTIGVDPSLQKLAIPEVYITSFIIYAVSAFLYFVMLLFRSMDDVNFSTVLNRGDAEFGDKLKASRGLQ
jgi:hypothetical protein